jgi:photosystem II stability/assembly factor-like uncharacterized protein
MKMRFLKKAHLIVLVLGLAWVFLMYWPGEVRASIGPFGGDITSAVIDPNNPSILYAGTYGGGVFKSTNAGESWLEANTGLTELNSRYVYGLAIHPSNSATIYAPTGGGIFKSTNGGGRWVSVAATAYGSLVIDPADANTIYAGSRDGLLRSTDGGANWFNVGFRGLSILALTVSPADSNTIYTCPAYISLRSHAQGIYKSTDRGGSWVNLGFYNEWITTIIVDFRNPSTVYTLLPGKGIFKSTDGGASWSGVNTEITRQFWGFGLSPRDSDTIYAPAETGLFKSTNAGASWSIMIEFTQAVGVLGIINPWDSDTLYAAQFSNPYTNARGGMFKSTDGGQHWLEINSGLANRRITAIAMSPIDPSMIHVSTDRRGIFKSTSSGENWVEVNAGFTNRSVWALALDPKDPKTLYAGGERDVFKSVNGGASWSASGISTRLGYGYIGALAIDPYNSNIIYAGASEGVVYKSTDAGETWSRVSAGLGTGSVSTLAIDPKDSNTIYMGINDGGVFKSTNGGATWSGINVGLSDRSVRALSINAQDPRILYVGTYTGGVFKSINRGESWFEANTGFTNRSARSLAIDPTALNTIYAGTGTGVFRSTDAGATWASTGMANYSITSLAVDPESPNTIYVGTEGNSLFVSYNGGRTWDGQNPSWLHPDIPNGDFERLDENGLPAHWQIVWHNSGSGAAFQYDSGGADAFQGNSVLRLHVDPGGGSTFVLSDAIPIAPGTTYQISSRMRFNLAADSDAVFFSIIQFDNDGNVVGFDEVRGRQGENYWTWQARRLLIRTSPNTTSIRIRFGLLAAGESYMDVDAVR